MKPVRTDGETFEPITAPGIANTPNAADRTGLYDIRWIADSDRDDRA